MNAACGSLLGGNFHTPDFGAEWISFKDFFRKNRFGCTGHPTPKYPGKMGMFKGKMLLVEDKR
jgi:hypothetical protein